MQQAEELFRQGKLSAAIESLQSRLRNEPSDLKSRSFLFELLCFAGEFERARKQLLLVGGDSEQGRRGVAFYAAALSAEAERQQYYEDADLPGTTPEAEPEVSGECDGRRFSGIRDLDRRLGASLEFLAAGSYHRIAFRNLRSLDISAPARTRDLYWIPAKAEVTQALGGAQLDSILIPVLYPQTYLFDDDQTRLGRTTDWAGVDDGSEIPCGQRMLIIGGEEIPLLDIRCITFDGAAVY